jgi:hypothetical protein
LDCRSPASYQQWLVAKLWAEVRNADEDKDPALKELQDACQNYVRNLWAEYQAWYRRGYTDATFGLPSRVPNLTNETKAESN